MAEYAIIRPEEQLPEEQATSPTGTRKWSAALQGLWSRDAFLMAGSLLLVVILVLHGLSSIKELGFDEDESRNAVTGLYVADFLSDLPLKHPIDYTYRYYAQYPALGIVHWPPFFHFVEGLMFLIAGRSVEVARLTTLCFLLVGMYFWFKLVRDLSNARAAAFATVLLALLPSMFLFERTAMLEVPSLALCLVASYYWVRYLRTGQNRFIYIFACAVAMALLTKTHAVYLAGFSILTVIAGQRWKLVWRRSTLWAFLLCALLVVPYYALALRVHGGSLEQHVIQHRAYTWDDLIFYWRALPALAGWPLVALSGVGLAVFASVKRRQGHFMLLWIVAVYLAFTFLRARELRYSFYWLPPFAFFASWPLMVEFPKRWSRILAGAACMLVLGSYAYTAWGDTRYPYLSGYSDAARWLASTSRGPQIVLYDGPDNGNFIFYVRKNDPQRRFVILRKALYVTRLVAFFGQKELAHTPEQVKQTIAEYGIRYVVVSDNPAAIWFPVQETLRQVLREPQFRLVAQFPIESRAKYIRSSNLLIYENQQAASSSTPYLRIPMMTLDHDIVVPLAEFEKGQQN